MLAVIDVEADPLETFDILAGFGPPQIDFLLPHATWERPPAVSLKHLTYQNIYNRYSLCP